MKNIFKRLMNFFIIFFLVIISLVFFDEFESKYFVGYLILYLSFIGIMGGLNYIFFGKFTLWNQKDETE
jgi:hypothetical protein